MGHGAEGMRAKGSTMHRVPLDSKKMEQLGFELRIFPCNNVMRCERNVLTTRRQPQTTALWQLLSRAR